MATFERPEDAELSPKARAAAVEARRSEHFAELARRSVEARQLAARTLAERTTAAQGLPLKVADPGALEVVAVVFLAGVSDVSAD